jgi:hypothetical protein
MAWLYAAMGKRLGGKAGFAAVFHVLSYGAVPRVATLMMWLPIALLVGRVTFVAVPPAGTDTFVVVLLRAATIGSLVAFAWGCLLEVMGLSEVFDLKLAKAFALWIFGLLIYLALALLAVNLTGGIK